MFAIETNKSVHRAALDVFMINFPACHLLSVSCFLHLPLGLLLLCLFIILCSPGERPEDPQDLLQEVQEAPAPQSDPVQEGKGFPLRTG